MANINNTTMSTVRLGNIEDHACGMPIAEVLVNDKVCGYLSPFRGYCFQVSATFEGCGNLASSQVIGLRKIAQFTTDVQEPSNEDIHGIRRELMMGQAMIALNNFAYRYNAVLDVETLADKQPDGWFGYTVLHEFVDRTLGYLNPKPAKKAVPDMIDILRQIKDGDARERKAALSR